MKKEIEYPFSNAIIFAKVMEDPNNAIPFLERIFRGRKIEQVIVTERISLTSKIDIANTNELNIKSEVTLQPNSIKAKGIRLDVLFKDDNAWYDIEMQVAYTKNLPKRSRYYHGCIDTQTLGKGMDYSVLKKSYVIFICIFDPFNQDSPMYFFEKYDKENDLPLNDESYTIMLNTESAKLDIPEELKSVFDYINTGEVNPNDPLLVSIHSRVEELQDDEEVLTIITLEEQHALDTKWAREEGIEIGERNKSLETARILKQEGDSLEKIQRVTKLSREEIEKL